jgi:hypothetical protein
MPPPVILPQRVAYTNERLDRHRRRALSLAKVCFEYNAADDVDIKGSIAQRETTIGEKLSHWSRQIFVVPRPMILP